jgi:hypothetical protein
MTIREKLLQMLFENGLFENQAQEVLTQYSESEIGEAMKDRLDDLVSDYPEPVLAVTWLGVKSTTTKWMDANCPEHWARPMFT